MMPRLAVMRFLGMFLVMAVFFGNSAILYPVKLYAAPKAKVEVQGQSTSELVNVNKASQEELVTVQGIGPSLAKRIIQYREEHGPFKQADDLVSVNGIGGAKLQKIKNQVTV